MNIVYHSSNSFVPVLGVSIVSILQNNIEAEIINVYIIENRWTEDNKRLMEALVGKYSNANLYFIPMPNMNEDYRLGLKQIKSIWLFDSYSRLFLGSILPENVDRVLYLDCDTLCNGSLREFYDTDFEDNYAAGVIDCLSDPYYELFDMDKNSRYCNSGMLLFNLKKWRDDNMEKTVADYVRSKNGYVFFMEQSVVNILLQNKIKIVHPRYNTYTLMVAFSHDNLRRLRHCTRYYTDSEIDEAVNNPVIIHLTNGFYVKGRPWIEGNKHPFNNLFMKYRALTPWKKEPLFPDKSNWKQKAVTAFVQVLPQSVMCSIVGWVYNVWRPNHIRKSMK